MLPSNVLRPSPADYAPAWGDAVVPEGYGGRGLEVIQTLSERAASRGDPGFQGIGASIGVLPPGGRPCPLHHHLVEEEVFFVLDGELTARELASDAEHYTEFALRPGELVAYPAGTGLAHQSRNRSAADVRYLALSSPERAPGEICVYPDSGKVLLRGVGLGVLGGDAGALEAARQAARRRGVVQVGREDRPRHVQGPDRVPERSLGAGSWGRALGRAAGASQLGINLDRLAPGAASGPLHWHTRDDELLLVLSGAPVLRQVRAGVEERALLQPGDLVGWAAGDKVAHQVLGGEDGAVFLIVGTDRADDVVTLPDTGEVFVRALGRRGPLAPAAYFAGED